MGGADQGIVRAMYFMLWENQPTAAMGLGAGPVRVECPAGLDRHVGERIILGICAYADGQVEQST
jgi:hypothetical protein